MKFSFGNTLALALISASHASPHLSERVPSGPTVISEENIAIQGVEGIFTIYDNEALPLLNATEDSTSAPLHRRCGSNQIRCDYQSFRADTRICGLLMDRVGGDHHFTAAHLTDICFTVTNADLQHNPKCCISWPRRVPGLARGHLLPAATDSFRCARNGLVSAYATDVNLVGICTVQCLSNRPDGCR